MPRLSYKQYQQRTLVAMALYTGFMLLVWPMVRTVDSLPLKVLLALTPLLPMFYVLAQMARRIRDSDGLEQRTHLVALGVATGVTAALSLLGGFLCVARLLPLDGSILIWVFPLMMVTYGATRWYVARGYGLDVGCGEGAGGFSGLHLLLLGLVLAVAAVYGWRHQWDSLRTGLLTGLAAALLVSGLVLGLAQRGSREHAGE